MSSAREAIHDARLLAEPQRVLFAESPPGVTFGVVTDSEPSSLALLAAGVAGMAARRARRKERMSSLAPQKPES